MYSARFRFTLIPVISFYCAASEMPNPEILPAADSIAASSVEPIIEPIVAPTIATESEVKDSLSSTPSANVIRGDSAESELLELDPMVVVAKAGGRLERLTGTVSRLDSNFLKRMQPAGTQEALERMPGVQGLADDGAGNSRLSIGIRGLPARRSSRVLILEDGIAIAPALYLYPNMYYNPPAERIDEMEIVKGAAAVQYGPQTMGGVVNYITRRPRRTFGGLVQAVGGENGYGSLYGEVGGWGKPTLHPEVQLLYKRGDGYRDNNGFEQVNATLKLNWLASDRDALYLKVNGNYEMSDATYTGLTEYSFREDPNFNPKEFDTFEVHRYAVDLIHTRDLGDFGARTTKLYGSVFLRDWWREDDIFVLAANYRNHVNDGDALMPVGPLDYPGADLVRVGGGARNYGNLREFYILGLDNQWELQHEMGPVSGMLNLGARVHWERFADSRVVGNSPSAREADAVHFAADSTVLGAMQNFETLALSLYGTEELRMGKLTLKPGLRLEIFEQERIDRLRGSRYNDHSEYVVLPGLGLNYALPGHAHLFAGVHRGYTPPSTSTLQLLNFGANTGAGGGLDLRSEKSWNSELGARASSSHFAAELCAYNLYIEDLVAPATGATFRNLGKALTYGVEALAEAKGSALNPFFPDLRLAYTWLMTEVLEGEIPASQTTGATADISGNQLPYAPEHTLVAGLSRDFAFGLSLGIDAKWVSQVYTDYENLEVTKNRGDTGPIDGYAVYGATIAYKVGRYRVFANAKNLLDNVYMSSRLHSHPSGIQANQSSGILIGPRRQINVGTALAF
jgi:Fe(3+) dicitrate transport protein